MVNYGQFEGCVTFFYVMWEEQTKKRFIVKFYYFLVEGKRLEPVDLILAARKMTERLSWIFELNVLEFWILRMKAAKLEQINWEVIRADRTTENIGNKFKPVLFNFKLDWDFFIWAFFTMTGFVLITI